MTFVIFSLILLYIPLWLQINMFFSGLEKGRKTFTIIKDKKISGILWKKAKTKIETIKISESNLLFGAMAGIPGNPQLFLSRKLYKSFNWDELEYVLMHEAGHYKLGHSVKELLEGLMFFGVGVAILNQYPNIFLAVILGLVFGILMIQIAKFKEVEADNYSLERVGNPKGMITATEKFRKAWKGTDPNNKLIRFLFFRGNPYENRFRMAKEFKNT